MKKYLFTIAAVAFALCACQKAETGTGTNEVTPGVNEEVGAPQQILIGTNLKSSELLTKGSVDYWNGQKVYVIGYDNAKIGMATEVTTEAGFIMPNTQATAPASDAEAEVNTELMTGKLDFGDAKFYYDENVQSYDFVGYYLGENAEGVSVEGVPNINEGTLTVPFTIDGSQDILAAITDIDNDRKFEENGAEKAVKTEYVYSAFASRREVHPTLKFNHMLTKFSFKVTYGSNSGDENKFKLQSISLDTYTRGVLTFKPEERESPAVEATGETGKVTRNTNVEFTTKEQTANAGELMVLPGKAEYQMTLVYSQDKTDDENHEYMIPIKIGNVAWKDGQEHPDITEFQAGKHYVVNVKVYGLEKIEVNVELVEWEEVGSVEIDPDDDGDKIEY